MHRNLFDSRLPFLFCWVWPLSLAYGHSGSEKKARRLSSDPVAEPIADPDPLSRSNDPFARSKVMVMADLNTVGLNTVWWDKSDLDADEEIVFLVKALADLNAARERSGSRVRGTVRGRGACAALAKGFTTQGG